MLIPSSRCPQAPITPSSHIILHKRVIANTCRRGQLKSRAVSGDQGSSSAPVLHQRLYDAAVADSLHDLSLDFNKAYRGRCHTSVPVCMDDNDADAAPCDTTVVSAAHSQLDSMMAGFQAYLQYQQLVSQPKHAEVAGSAAGSSRQQPQVEQAQEQHLHSGSSSGGPDSSSASGSIDLLHCAVLIAKHAYPAADLEQVRKAVAELGRQAAALAATAEGGSAAAAAGSGAGGSRVRALAAAVSYVLYHLEGFGGAVDDFYHFDNQCINRLLETKQGSPALLALLYKLVAEAAGLELTPVTLPGHTFLQPAPTNANGAWSAASYLIDPFNAGQVCSSSVVEARLNACWGYPGQTLSLGPLHTTARHSSSSCSSSGSSFGSSHSGAAAAACDAWRGDRALLVRLLKNLREAYYGPLPLSGRIRWAMHLQGPCALRQSGPSSGTSSEAAAALNKLIAAAAAASSSFSSSSSSSSGSDGEDQPAAPPGGRELLTGALAVVRYHRVTAPQEVRLLRDEGYILHLLGRSGEGSALLQQYLAAAPAAADMHKVQEFVIADKPVPPNA